MATIPGLHNYHHPDSEISDSEGEGSPSSISAPGVVSSGLGIPSSHGVRRPSPAATFVPPKVQSAPSISLVGYGDEDDDILMDTSTTDAVQSLPESLVSLTKLSDGCQTAEVYDDGKDTPDVTTGDPLFFCLSDIELPREESEGMCSQGLQEKIVNLMETKRQLGVSSYDVIVRGKGFRNPSIYEKLIHLCEIDEFGTNYGKKVFDPKEWQKEEFYEKLAESQRKAHENKQKSRGNVEFKSGTKLVNTIKPAESGGGLLPLPATAIAQESHKKRKSKWDNPSSELKVASPSQSGSDPVVGAQALANARLIDKMKTSMTFLLNNPEAWLDMACVELKDSAALRGYLKEQKKLFVLHFWTIWSEPCRHINEALTDLAQNNPQCLFIKVEAEKQSEVSSSYNVTAVPTVLFIKDGQVIDRVNGANLPDICHKVKSLSANVLDMSGSSHVSKEVLNFRLKNLISASPCVLFMKGSPQEPRCGFSKQMVSILQDANIHFSSFDVLQDIEVRNGLKDFSNWPTYPQLYVNGEFVGGLDIIKELNESGKLNTIFPKVQPLNERLESLTSQSHIMLFMKGTPDNPKCGFSRVMCSILMELHVEFKAFDILLDEEVRQGLKKFSNWPTYPQLYVNGKFIGGLDIVKELHDTGELLGVLEQT